MSAVWRHAPKNHRRIPRRLFAVGIAVLIAIVVAAGFVRHMYYQNLEAVSNNQQTHIITVASGSSVKKIAKQLAEAGVIRNAWVFEWYVHKEELGNKLQAGTYALSPSQDLPDIVGTLTKGKVTTRLVTIVPGHRIDQVRAGLINDGFPVDAVDLALQPEQYSDLPVMSYVPDNVKTLEGLLYPESFQRSAETDPSYIIRESLRLMGEQITPDVQQAFAAKGLSVYQGLIISSIVEQEVSKQSDRDQVAQVFLLRLQKGMSLGSDPTAHYGAIKNGKAPSVNYDSPYNTRMHTGLPPTPISTMSKNSIKAVAYPASTDWLYFVSGDDGTTHFEHTYEEHQADAQQYCHELCGR